MFEQLKKIMEEKHSVTVCELCNIHDCGDSDEEHCKKCQFYKYSKWMNNPKTSNFELNRDSVISDEEVKKRARMTDILGKGDSLC